MRRGCTAPEQFVSRVRRASRAGGVRQIALAPYNGNLDPSMAEVLEGGVKRLDDAGRYMKRIFKRNE